MAPNLDKKTVQAVLLGSYSPPQLRAFFLFCRDLAVAHVRRRVISGRLNLDVIRLSEEDLAVDSIAELFTPNHEKKFPKIADFVLKMHPNIGDASPEELTRTFRRLIFTKVNQELIRILAEADPVLAAILRNIHASLERTGLFYKDSWLNEMYLVPRDVDWLKHCPPMQDELLEHRFLQVAKSRDSVPDLIRKLHKIVTEQEHCRRMVPVVGVAILFRKVIVVEDTEQLLAKESAESPVAMFLLLNEVDAAIERVHNEATHTYVRTSKCTVEELAVYMSAVRIIFFNRIHAQGDPEEPYYEVLRQCGSDVTQTHYREHDKRTLEYLVRLTKQHLGWLRRELE